MIHHPSSFPNSLSSLLTTFFTHEEMPATLHIDYSSNQQQPSLSFQVNNTSLHLEQEVHKNDNERYDEYTGTLSIHEPSLLTQASIQLHSNQNKIAWLGLKEQVQSKVYSITKETTCFNNMRALIQQGKDLEEGVTYTFPSIQNIEIPLFSTKYLLVVLFDKDFQVYQEYEAAFTELINKKKGSKEPMIILSLPVNVNISCQLARLPANIHLLSMNDITATTTILPFSLSFDILFNFTSQSTRRLVEEEEESLSIESLLSQVFFHSFISFYRIFYPDHSKTLSINIILLLFLLYNLLSLLISHLIVDYLILIVLL